jgi:ADP-heptose:LPS heptosyltransferase
MGSDPASISIAASGGLSLAGARHEQLRELAFYGHREHVRALFESLPPAERGSHSTPEVLRRVVEGSLARLRSPSAVSAELVQERKFLESVVELFVSDSCARQVFPKEMFHTLHDWSEQLLLASRLTDAQQACTLALALGATTHPEIGPWIQLRLARTQMLLGDFESAYATLMGTYARLDRIADRNAVAALLDALCTASLQTRRGSVFKRLLVERLRVFHANVDERRAAVQLMHRVHRGARRLLAANELSPGDKLLWLTHWVLHGAARRVGVRRAARLLERSALASAYVCQYGVSRRRGRGSAPRIDATLVTRAMGGIGDLLMMTPGLRALKAMQPERPIVLAIPPRFFPLFEGNADVELLNIDGDVEPAAYAQWFNLTDCPAARVEHMTAPRVKANRIELFARALGVRRSALKAMDRRPRYVVSDAERRWRDLYFARVRLDGAVVIGVQRHTDEAYRDVPHMQRIIDALAREARVLVFGDRPQTEEARPGVLYTNGLDLRKSFALASGCDLLVTPDSAFFHLSGALDLPCVGLFGPTDGRVRGHDYPRSRALDVRRQFPCVPCWRNEIIPCALTGLRPSPCLGHIEVTEVLRAVREKLLANRPCTSPAEGLST